MRWHQLSLRPIRKTKYNIRHCFSSTLILLTRERDFLNYRVSPLCISEDKIGGGDPLTQFCETSFIFFNNYLYIHKMLNLVRLCYNFFFFCKQTWLKCCFYWWRSRFIFVFFYSWIVLIFSMSHASFDATNNHSSELPLFYYSSSPKCEVTGHGVHDGQQKETTPRIDSMKRIRKNTDFSPAYYSLELHEEFPSARKLSSGSTNVPSPTTVNKKQKRNYP